MKKVKVILYFFLFKYWNYGKGILFKVEMYYYEILKRFFKGLILRIGMNIFL